MLSSAPQVNTFEFATNDPLLRLVQSDPYRQIYQSHQHRVYALCFWMTDNELAAEDLMIRTFQRAFESNALPDADAIDQALIAELRKWAKIGGLTLNCGPVTRVVSVRRNTLRVELERALVQLPATEKLIFVLHDVEGYAHQRIASLLTITDSESRNGLHQARLRIRQLLEK